MRRPQGFQFYQSETRQIRRGKIFRVRELSAKLHGMHRASKQGNVCPPSGNTVGISAGDCYKIRTRQSGLQVDIPKSRSLASLSGYDVKMARGSVPVDVAAAKNMTFNPANGLYVSRSCCVLASLANMLQWSA